MLSQMVNDKEKLQNVFLILSRIQISTNERDKLINDNNSLKDKKKKLGEDVASLEKTYVIFQDLSQLLSSIFVCFFLTYTIAQRIFVF